MANLPCVAPVDIDIDQLFDSVQLPALPQSAIMLLELSQDASNGPAEFTRPIEADAGLMGQVLRFVNSSYFGFSREIGSIRQALALVGVRTIKNFALWNAVFSLVPDPQFGTFKLQKLWQDSLRRAVFARILGRKIDLDNSEELFAAALLQDMAIPLLLQELPEHYEALIQRRGAEHQRLSQLEREVFGWDHGQVAAGLVRNWKLPDEFARLIERHPDFESLISGSSASTDAACVALAALLPSCDLESWAERDAFVGAVESLAAGRKLSIDSILEESDKAFEEFAPVMRLPIPDMSLSDWLKQDAD